MASLVNMTSATLSEMLKREISDVTVLVAKNMILGGSKEALSQILGASESEIDEIFATQDYKDCHLVMAAQYNHDSVATDLTYDEIEQKALGKLVAVLEREKDPDRLVRIATMANKATRRQKMPTNPDVLDPGSARGQVRLTLTKRIVERLNATSAERSVTEQISIHSGSSKPSFEEIQGFFGEKPRAPDEQVIHNQGEEISEAALRQLLGGN